LCKTFGRTSVALIVSAGLFAALYGGETSAQCYPGLACPPSADTSAAPQPLTPQDAVPPAHPVRPVQPGVKRSFWTHNGSLVYLTAEGDGRSFYYERPREAIRAAGAEPGTLLFQGQRRGQTYSGTAYVFAGRCGAIPYQVRGTVSNQDRRVTMEGQAPSGISRDCQVTGSRRDVLVFDYSHRE
jgi:hypothetical protein